MSPQGGEMSLVGKDKRVSHMEPLFWSRSIPAAANVGMASAWAAWCAFSPNPAAKNNSLQSDVNNSLFATSAFWNHQGSQPTTCHPPPGTNLEVSPGLFSPRLQRTCCTVPQPIIAQAWFCHHLKSTTCPHPGKSARVRGWMHSA